MTYRFLFIPSTIGAIAWMSENRAGTSRIRHGLVLAGVGDPGRPTYKRSRRGDAGIDRAVEHVLRHSGDDFEVIDFWPYGYDERQYCSPGFDLPVGCFMRTPGGGTLRISHVRGRSRVRPSGGLLRLKVRRPAVVPSRSLISRHQNPVAAPPLAVAGRVFGGRRSGRGDRRLALFWVSNLSDSRHSLLDIAGRSGLRFDVVRAAADTLLEADLIADV